MTNKLLFSIMEYNSLKKVFYFSLLLGGIGVSMPTIAANNESRLLTSSKVESIAQDTFRQYPIEEYTEPRVGTSPDTLDAYRVGVNTCVLTLCLGK